MLTVFDLFSGIGGFSLGLERAGLTTVGFCEIDPRCRAVLKRHWPDVPIFNDIKDLNINALELYGIEKPNVLCGGFPCQDVSSVKVGGAGVGGERSGLWSEFARLIENFRPRYAVIENVANLRSRGLVSVLHDLRAIGYDAEWHIIPAAAVGSVHLRERIWIVAYSVGGRVAPLLAKPPGRGTRGAEAGGLQCTSLRNSHGESRTLRKIPGDILLADGLSEEVGASIKMYGNAVVPQIPEYVGWQILKAEARRE